MGDTDNSQVGTICWTDLTIDDAESLKDFYSDVVGWKPEPCSMGDYNDFNMSTADGTAIAGICHARGSNAAHPRQWLIYLTVEDADKSADRCVERGGTVLVGPKDMGSQGRYCVIQDPAGAVAALIAPLV